MPMYNTSQPRPEADHRKPCTLCGKLCDVRVRCQIDESQTWHLVCPSKCWKEVSGGVVDGDGGEGREYYRYGGMWKNKQEAVSAKTKKGGSKGKRGGGRVRKISRESRVESDAEGEEGEGEGGETVNGVEDAMGKDGVWSGEGKKYTRNDEVMFEGELWICRKSHVSEEGKTPREAKNLWKEAVGWKEEES